MEGKQDVNNFRVGDIPTLIYIPDFITDEEQNHLLDKIYGAPASKWKPLKNRRLQNWGGVVHEKGLLPQDLPPWLRKITHNIYEHYGFFPSPINHVLINEYLPDQGIMSHQDGPAYYPVAAILSLVSPAVMNFTPHPRQRLNSDSRKDLNSDMEASNDKMDPSEGYNHPRSVLLMPRSLLIFKDNAYSDYLHGIKDCEIQEYDGVVNATEALPLSIMEKHVQVGENGDDKIIRRTETRVSLTCRLVPKVHKNLFRF